MALIKIFYEGLEEITSLTALETDPIDFPKENLQDRDANIKYKSANNIFHEIVIDYGLDHIADSCAIGKYSLSLFANITFSYSPDGVAWSDVTNQNSNVIQTGTVAFEFDEAMGRFWRILIHAGFSSTYTMGSIFLGKALVFETAPIIGEREGLIAAGVSKIMTINGLIRANKRYGAKKTWTYFVEAMLGTQKANSLLFFDSVTGTHYSFIFSNVTEEINTARMAQDSLDMDQKGVGYFNAGFKLIQEL